MKFYSNGKLLLTGEYLILDGAKALAAPTKFGQELSISRIKEPQIIWKSFTDKKQCWFEATFDLPKLKLLSATFNSNQEGSSEFIAETLLTILKEARKLNPMFLQIKNGLFVKTNLTFPIDWGLGSSSTLVNTIASWAKVNAYKLLWNTFSGSGYDIACAQNNTPIFYQLENKIPKITKTNFNPNFSDSLFFVHLNKKQNSREGIAKYRKDINTVKDKSIEIDTISKLSEEFATVSSVNDLEKIIFEHEKVISSIIKLKPIKENLFSDYFGEIKSLGAWGGDFILVTGNKHTSAYFKKKGFETIRSYKQMIL